MCPEISGYQGVEHINDHNWLVVNSRASPFREVGGGVCATAWDGGHAVAAALFNRSTLLERALEAAWQALQPGSLPGCRTASIGCESLKPS